MSGGGFFGGFGGPRRARLRGFWRPGFGAAPASGGGPGFGGPRLGSWRWRPLRQTRPAAPQAGGIGHRGDVARRAGRRRADRAAGVRQDRRRLHPSAGHGGACHRPARRPRRGDRRQRRGDADRFRQELSGLARHQQRNRAGVPGAGSQVRRRLQDPQGALRDRRTGPHDHLDRHRRAEATARRDPDQGAGSPAPRPRRRCTASWARTSAKASSA